MKYQTGDGGGCGCRSAGESCRYCDGTSRRLAEKRALGKLHKEFSKKTKDKLFYQVDRGRLGWNYESWTLDDIKQAIILHIEKGDFVDVANLAAFAWNRQDGGKK